jgi:hypothetical protein
MARRTGRTFYRFVRDNFYGGNDVTFSEKEIPSEVDARTAEQVHGSTTR